MMKHSELKRSTPLKQQAPMARRREKKGPGLAQRIAESLGVAIKHVKKESSVFRSEAHRRNVAALACVCCSIEKQSQAAHLNLLALGKGRGWKVSDALTIPLCIDQVGAMGCHARLDSSGQYDRATSEGLQLMWLHRTREQLISMGQWPEQAEADMVRFVGVYLQRAE